MQPTTPPESKKSRTWAWIAIAAVVFLLVGLGGGYELGKSMSTASSSMPSTVTGLSRPSVTPDEPGWYRNTSITYLLFGTDPNITAPILAFYEASSPSTPVAGQRNVIDTLPGQPSYSDFWQVYKVLTPAGYVANSIRSFSDAVASGDAIEATSTIVNCPVENPGATEANSSAGLEMGWYRGETVYYFNAGTNTTGWGPVIQTAPIYTFVYASGGAVPGQRNIVDVLPGQTGYSDLWQLIEVTVNSSYIANSVMSASEVLALEHSGKVTLQPTAGFVNCPVVKS
jgi:hypothetical protein